jgi:uncharacterized protein YggE
MKIILLFLYITFSLSLSAKNSEPTAQFRGVGRMEAKPDFVKLIITIRSECYESPALAQEETDKAVKSIHDYLKTLKRGDKFFKIFVSGGFTSAFSRWYKDRELCRNTFQKDTQIELKVGMSPDFDKTFGNIQSYLLNTFKRGLSLGEDQNPLTYVQIGAPSPLIEEAHKQALLKKALNLAMLDAKNRFKAATKSCAPSKWKVLSVQEANHNIYAPVPQAYAARAKFQSSSPEIVAPVSFEDLKIEARLDVTFGFDGSLCYEAE